MSWKKTLANGISDITIRNTDVRVICLDAGESKKVLDTILTNSAQLYLHNFRLRPGVTCKDFMLRFTSNIMARDFASNLKTAMTSAYPSAPVEEEREPEDTPSLEDLIAEDPTPLTMNSGKIGGTSPSEEPEEDVEQEEAPVVETLDGSGKTLSVASDKKKKIVKFAVAVAVLFAIVLVIKKMKK